jgi:CheY-like chemotaxis protein
MDRVPVILLAEDDPNDVFFLRRAFQSAAIKCQILDVPNGQEAIHYLQGTGSYSNRTDFPRPALLLMDLKMPLLDGFDLLTWLQSQSEFAELPAVVLSSSAHEEDISRCQTLGARGYHVKPSDLVQLTQLAREFESRYLQTRVLTNLSP